MKTRQFEKLGLTVPLLGFGTMRLPVKDGQIDKPAAQAMVDYAMAHGVNYFDTAIMYHNFLSEDFVGEALEKYPRESYTLTSKMHVDYVNSKQEMAEMFERQLKKCRTDHFDFYLIHDVERAKFDKIRQLEVYNFIKQKQAEGAVKYIGFSFHDTAQQLQKFLEEYDYAFDVVQIQENYLDTVMREGAQQYQLLTEHDIPVIVMEPVKGGLLSNVPDSVARLFEDAKPRYSPAAWALRWVGSLPNVRIVLSGMSSMEQLRENVALFEQFTPMTDAEYQIIGQARELFSQMQQVPCTACRYCAVCPVGVAIPEIFNNYNRLKLFGEREHFRIRLTFQQHLKENQLPTACVACGACERACPQHIHIIDELKNANTAIQAIL